MKASVQNTTDFHTPVSLFPQQQSKNIQSSVPRKRRYKTSYKTKEKEQYQVSTDDKLVLLWKVVKSKQVPVFKHPVSHYLLSKEASGHCLKASLEHPNLKLSKQVIDLVFSQIAREGIE